MAPDSGRARAQAVPLYRIKHCPAQVADAITAEVRNQLCFYLPEDPPAEYRRAKG